ncbi:MAG: hypothetical protein H3C29_08230 [Simplicispira suum]|uniref:hypothetical protein n=1 Tax=Simplicispira suum TaxID=2109915 RepID=UPI001C6B0D3E|nr:hypothetical protein [Simplicispira suum]MBW7833190.1 hypothetical protein [Simplicispira suum]
MATSSISIKNKQAARPRLQVEQLAARRLKSWLRRGASPCFTQEFRHARGVLRELVLCLDRRHPEGLVWPTQETIGGSLGITERWARECLRWLEQRGYIKSVRWAFGKRSGYSMHPIFWDEVAWPELDFQALKELPPWPSEAPKRTEKSAEIQTLIFKKKGKEKQGHTLVSPELASGQSPEVASDIPEFQATRRALAWNNSQVPIQIQAHTPPWGGSGCRP